MYPKENHLDVEITELTAVHKLSVPCPSCAAAPGEWCCEIANGAFRQDAHFARLLSAAGQRATSHQHKPATDALSGVALTRAEGK